MPLGLALAFGARAAGEAFSRLSERRQQNQLRERRRKNLSSLEARRDTLAFGPSESGGAIEQAVTKRTLGSLNTRGVLDSTFAGGDVAAAVAPIEAQRQERLDNLDFRIATAQDAIDSETSSTGFGDVLGGAVGEVGDFLAVKAGAKEEEARRKRELQQIFSFARGDQGGDQVKRANAAFSAVNNLSAFF